MPALHPVEAQLNIADADTIISAERLRTMRRQRHAIENRAIDAAHIGYHILIAAALYHRVAARRVTPIVVGEIQLGLVVL